ncbi:aminotransferase class V-fold PLP-dependent enzyme [Bifidobacterium sp. MA2]|uniref:Aminotransferase class V-fold PLP-dependent enzyme n=1 Tax=Bifidobacterium santillanense TaxID=2809028 RepID=A0ABS5UM19_9BIFI|nr:aminotransferase class V-fold PLP-dependent enzyme [Bifidobacterium santillanense]MBT1171951.1 aminotransferase class V-fold PLP-dependent enzyme [Bifidobacterium santillanense]
MNPHDTDPEHPERPAPLTLPDGSPAIDAWPLDRSVIHLNHGSFGAVPNRTRALQNAYEARADTNPVGWFPYVGERIASMRAQLAGFLNVPADHAAWVPNASAGASVVYANVHVPRGGEILVTDHGYGAVLQGAARMARRDGATLRTVHVPIDADGDMVVDIVTSAMTDRTAFIVVDQITSATAMLLPAKRIAAEAHRRGIRILVDGAHAPGQLDDPIGGLASDWWMGNFHKFPCAPRGTALLVLPPAGGRDGQDLWPLIDSWGYDRPFPERFDEQGTQDLCGPIAAPDAWREIDRLWGWDAVRRYMTALADYAERHVAQAAGEISGEDCSSPVRIPSPAMRLVRLPRFGRERTPRESAALCAEFRSRILDELGAEVAVTEFGGELYLRLTAHAYVTVDDVDRFAECCVPRIIDWLRE